VEQRLTACARRLQRLRDLRIERDAARGTLAHRGEQADATRVVQRLRR
jgi:hypothetical protein